MLKPACVFDSPREEVITFIPSAARTVLDVRCSRGAFARRLQSSGHQADYWASRDRPRSRWEACPLDLLIDEGRHRSTRDPRTLITVRPGPATAPCSAQRPPAHPEPPVLVIRMPPDAQHRGSHCGDRAAGVPCLPSRSRMTDP